jgi:hypothetical protein
MAYQLISRYFNTDISYVILEYGGSNLKEYRTIMTELIIPIFTTFNKYHFNDLHNVITNSTASYMKKYYTGARGYYNCVHVIAILNNIVNYNHNIIIWQLKRTLFSKKTDNNISPVISNNIYGLKSQFHQDRLDGPPDLDSSWYDDLYYFHYYKLYVDSSNKELLLCNRNNV